ncbi:MAG TPA: MipA/OmpV family protein [Kiritimatiellia bacterium]|nr:MipA/OmpV family protein [Kiritimatiellia bacterium]
MNEKRFPWLLLCWGIGLLTSPALASESENIFRLGEGIDEVVLGYSGEADLPPPVRSSQKMGVGAQILVQSNPYRDGDTVVMALPMITYVGERFFVVSPRAGVHLYRHPIGGINAIADFRFKGEAFESKGFLSGMEDRKNTAMAGLDGHLRLPGRYRVDLTAMTDILDRHNGQEVNLALSRVFRLQHLMLIPGAGVVWRSADYNDYYYGVRASEATEARPSYNPGDGLPNTLEWFARLAFRYDLTPNWSLASAVRVEVLGSEVRDSPTVRRDYLTTFIAGVNYFF